MNRIYTILISIFGTLIVLVASFAFFQPTFDLPQPILNKPLQYSLSATATGTVYEMMNYAASSTRTFSFIGKTYPSLGFFVEQIGGKENSDGFYWTLYVNGVYSNKGASAQEVYPGDRIEWRYEKL